MSGTKQQRKEPVTYTYVVHVTESVESKCTITSKRKLTYEEIMRRAKEIQVEGNLDEIGTSDVRMCLDDAKPGPGAVARPRVRRRVA